MKSPATLLQPALKLLSGRAPYDINMLKTEDAVKLLRKDFSRLSEQEAKEIAEIGDYLPRVLKPAVGLLRRGGRLGFQ